MVWTGVYLLLLKAIYRTKQAAARLWVLFVSVFAMLNFARSSTDPCMFFKWTDNIGLMLWLSWVDDCLYAGNNKGVKEAKQQFKEHFEVDTVGPLEEYVGCKIDYDRENHKMKLNQPVLIHSLDDKCNIQSEDKFQEHLQCQAKF